MIKTACIHGFCLRDIEGFIQPVKNDYSNEVLFKTMSACYFYLTIDLMHNLKFYFGS